MRKLWTVLLLLAFFESVQAKTITAISSGNWVLNGTWNCNCIPKNGDSVIIPFGITVNVTRPIAANGVVISVAGQLDITNGALMMNYNDRVTIMQGGRIFADGLGGAIYIGTLSYIIKNSVEGPLTINTSIGSIKNFYQSTRRHDYSYQIDSRSEVKNIFTHDLTVIDSKLNVYSVIRVNPD